MVILKLQKIGDQNDVIFINKKTKKKRQYFKEKKKNNVLVRLKKNW